MASNSGQAQIIFRHATVSLHQKKMIWLERRMQKKKEKVMIINEKWLKILIVLTPIIWKRMMIHWEERKFAIKKRI